MELKSSPPFFRHALAALVLLNLGTFRGRAAESSDGRIGAADPRFRYEGRIDSSDPEGPILIWQGTRVGIDFEGESLALLFGRADQPNYFDVRLDGLTWVATVPAGGPSRLAFPSALPPGRHHFALHKRQEAAAGNVQFRGIEIDPGAQVWNSPAPYSVAMEFIGDSITAGACDEDGPEDQWDDRRTHNSELGYAAVTARAFRADYRNIAVSGMGVVTGWVKPLARQVWDRLYPQADSPAADLSLWKPDIVFVNLGENDDSYSRAHGQAFPSAYTLKYCDLIESIRKSYPQAEIVLLRGGMFGGAQSKPLREAWQAAVDSLKARDPRVHSFVFTHWTRTHPRVADHRAMADELIAWLRAEPFMKPFPRAGA